MQNSMVICSVFPFLTGDTLFWANLVQKKQNCQFQLKFGTQTNSNMHNSMAIFTCFSFQRKFHFGKFGSKNQNCQFRLVFVTCTNSNMQNSMMVFSFSVLDQKQHFWANLVQKTQNCQFKLKYGTTSNLIMQNSVVVFTFLLQTGNNIFGQVWS